MERKKYINIILTYQVYFLRVNFNLLNDMNIEE